MDKKQKGINYAIAETKQRLTEVINESALPPACMLLILGEISSTVSLYAQQFAALEKEEFEKEDKNKESDCK